MVKGVHPQSLSPRQRLCCESFISSLILPLKVLKSNGVWSLERQRACVREERVCDVRERMDM